jgi:hypothetical protein
MSGLASLLSLRKSSTGSGHPMLTPDKPGTYVVRLTVSDGRRSRADSVNVSALFPSASVPIDTAVDGVAPNGTKMQGIAIGYHPAAHNYREPRGPEQFYPLPAGDKAQVLVLDRQTLGLVSINDFPAGPAFVGEVANILKPLDDTDLVIVTTWPDPGWKVPGQFPIAFQLTTPFFAPGPLAGIGASHINNALAQANGAVVTSNATWIGVPGFPAGTAWERMAGERSMPATMPALTASWRRMIRITTTTSPGPGPRSTSAPTAPRRSR